MCFRALDLLVTQLVVSLLSLDSNLRLDLPWMLLLGALSYVSYSHFFLNPTPFSIIIKPFSLFFPIIVINYVRAELLFAAWRPIL